MGVSDRIDINGKSLNVTCLSCALEQGRVEKVGAVLTTKCFDVHQDQETPIPGFFIVSSRRHFTSISEFTWEESIEFVEIVKRVRIAMRIALGIEEVVLIQKEGVNRHFHLWLFPRQPWMLDIQEYGTTLQSITSIMTYAREKMKKPKNLKLVSESVKMVREYLAGR